MNIMISIDTIKIILLILVGIIFLVSTIVYIKLYRNKKKKSRLKEIEKIEIFTEEDLEAKKIINREVENEIKASYQRKIDELNKQANELEKGLYNKYY